MNRVQRTAYMREWRAKQRKALGPKGKRELFVSTQCNTGVKGIRIDTRMNRIVATHRHHSISRCLDLHDLSFAFWECYDWRVTMLKRQYKLTHKELADAKQYASKMLRKLKRWYGTGTEQSSEESDGL